MKIFECPTCSGRLFFDNMSCSCGAAVAFDPGRSCFVTETSFCANREQISCNWVAGSGGGLCESCALTTVLPDLSVAGNQLLWSKAEQAKRRVLAGLRRWGWFGPEDQGPRPEFHMLSEATASGPADITMGHASGLVTINLAESDAAERVRRREEMGEPYRTMVGHFRHEIAHFLFERLAVTETFRDGFHALFGDETADYGAALMRHYETGPPEGWENAHISSYASAHPHEDWAESAAHALHLVDMVDSFAAARLSSEAFSGAGYDAYAEEDAARLLTAAMEIGVALNHVNRALGVSDLYPFVTPSTVLEKLAFAQKWLKLGQPA
ncbi:hypothetical protein DLJ49_20585 [Rhodovulum sp. 12E13]|uniref:zinc-binding metallopeptidase family protein n=1 Tax=Rhodovulum sp. 12E13 TaxID=2203891 RepID=UPI000E126964|nr:putative zinc-binding metallopeptidase [Rhodovulum sp. 12E13]RDC68007.1 hypothetical protein DLJ49_20585 [Rhodovulum sp. 12E13]